MKTFKVSLISTIFVAAFGLALGLMAVSSGSYACNTGVKHNTGLPCGGDDGGGEDPIVYTAELIAGAFEFTCNDPSDNCPSSGVVVVTPNQRENVLRSEVNLNLDINDSPERDTWDARFATCAELWDSGSVAAFFVGKNDWSIDKAGGVRVVFRHIESEGAEFRFQLIGDEFDFFNSFLPDPDDILPTRTYVLNQFAITAKSLAGGSGGTKFCRTLGGDPLFLSELLSDAGVPSTLVITASDPAP